MLRRRIVNALEKRYLEMQGDAWAKAVVRPEEITKVLEPERFRPFGAKVSSGDRYEIRHPEQVIFGRSTVPIDIHRHTGLRRRCRRYCEYLRLRQYPTA